MSTRKKFAAKIEAAPKLSSVSYVMPVLNEERFLAKAVESIFKQEQTGNTEVIIALGPSSDRTDEIAEDLANRLPVVLVDNPTGKTPAGLNAAIKQSRNDVVVRVDAHSELSPGYTKLAVQILNQTGAANVGGVMHAVGETAFQSAVAWAYNSRWGLGGGSFHVGGQAGPSDSVYLGVFRRTKLVEAGLFDERMIRGQDWELNLRLRAGGGVVWFDPRLWVKYFPRTRLRALARQFYDTGIWRAKLTKMAPGRANLRYFVPPLLVLSTVLILPALIYAAAVILIAASARDLSLVSKLNLLGVLPTMHYAWGLGFIKGVFQKVG